MIKTLTDVSPLRSELFFLFISFYGFDEFGLGYTNLAFDVFLFISFDTLWPGNFSWEKERKEKTKENLLRQFRYPLK